MATHENNHKNEARDDWTGCTFRVERMAGGDRQWPAVTALNKAFAGHAERHWINVVAPHADDAFAPVLAVISFEWRDTAVYCHAVATSPAYRSRAGSSGSLQAGSRLVADKEDGSTPFWRKAGASLLTYKSGARPMHRAQESLAQFRGQDDMAPVFGEGGNLPTRFFELDREMLKREGFDFEKFAKKAMQDAFTSRELFERMPTRPALAEPEVAAHKVRSYDEDDSTRSNGPVAAPEQPTPISGAGENDTGVARVHEQVAAKASTTDENGSWILASVVRYDATSDAYAVQDEDDQKILELPASRIRRLGIAYYNLDELQKGERVVAIFPETTSFYRAMVSKAPKPGPGGSTPREVFLKFEDDEDDSGRTPHRRVSLRYVLRERSTKHTVVATTTLVVPQSLAAAPTTTSRLVKVGLQTFEVEPGELFSGQTGRVRTAGHNFVTRENGPLVGSRAACAP